MKHCRLLTAFLVISLSLRATVGSGETVSGKDVVATQQDFEELLRKISSGKPVDAVLLDNDYYIDRGIVAGAPLRLQGRNATIRFAYDQYSPSDAVEHKDGFFICRKKSEIYPFSLFVDENDSLVEVSESVAPVSMVNRAPGRIEGKWEKRSGLRVRIPMANSCDHLKNRKFDAAYGYFDNGWSRVDFTVSDADGRYFNCVTLDSNSVASFNKDLEAYKKPVRYVIYNAERKPGCIYYDKDFLYVPDNVSKITVVRSKSFSGDPTMLVISSDLCLCDITFADFCRIYVKSPLSAECSITGCSFLNCVDAAVHINKEGGEGVRPVEVSGCTFLRCAVNSDYVIRMDSSSPEGNAFEFSDNFISRYPEDKVIYKNCSGAVGVYGSAHITDNTVCNTPRDHFFLTKGHISISSNAIYNSDGFNDALDRNLSSDLGLIYCNHIFSKSEEAVANKDNVIAIRDNILYGALSYGNIGTGIYIDDGRGDVLCEGNIVLNCGTSSIDSRSVDTFIGTASIRTVLRNNIMDNRYRLMSGKDVQEGDRPVADGNVLLGKVQPVTHDVERRAPDRHYETPEYIFRDGRLYMNAGTSRQIRKEMDSNPSVVFIPGRKFNAMNR